MSFHHNYPIGAKSLPRLTLLQDLQLFGKCDSHRSKPPKNDDDADGDDHDHIMMMLMMNELTDQYLAEQVHFMMELHCDIVPHAQHL